MAFNKVPDPVALDFDYLSANVAEGKWQHRVAAFYSRCLHCGDPIKPRERFYWHSEGHSIHPDCVEMHQGFHHAMSKDD